MLGKWYWQLRGRLKDAYLYGRYGRKPPRIYYDRLLKAYLYPGLLTSSGTGSCEWICAELAGTCCVYPYCLGGTEGHSHEFSGVLLAAYEHGEIFWIPDQLKGCYSGQELDWLDRLAEQGKKDAAERASGAGAME